jgi:2-hydroxy-3-keto-5-methylthiopentenyl-1-phosphate phosphatase
MAPTIRAVLSNLVGDEAASEIDVISNDVEIKEDGKWDIKYRHPTRWVTKTVTIIPVRMLTVL